MDLSKASIAFNGLCRYWMTYFLSGVLPLYVVTEYPRSGGTWFANMLSEYLYRPFPRDRLSAFRSCVMQGHTLFSQTIRNVFVVLKDGRDAMVSSYFHSFLRKGIAGDWRNYFNKEAREILHHYAGRELIRLGYEKDASWVCGS